LILDTGYWILDTGHWILDTGHWILDTGIKNADKVNLVSDFLFIQTSISNTCSP
jgi:uncharacterized protein YbcV (DUF1398 family)